MNDKRFLLEFIKNLSERDYAKADSSLQSAINEKIKARIKNNLKKPNACALNGDK
jgi:hypothetical protein